MNPTTIKKPTTRTSVGMETVDQTVARANQMRTGFTVPMPESVPAEALNGTYSISDVKMQRDNREQADAATAQFNTDYNNLTGRISNTKLNSPFTNPEQFLNGLLLRGTTDTQKALDTTGQTQADNIRNFTTDYTKAGADARTQFNIPGLQESLAETRTRRAEREVKLRETLRDFETNAERRGVAREFVDSEKAKVQSDAATELADLAIIESAQLGNLNEARTEVDNILAEKKQAFEFENAAIEAEIARLEKMDTRESNARSEQLQIALQERTRNIETQLANEKEQRGYLIDAAANGADQGTLAAIRNAKTPQEAAFLASPFIGKLDRQMQQAQIANIYDQIDARATAAREATLTATTEEEKVLAKKVADAEQALSIKQLAESIKDQAGLSAAVGVGFKKSVVGAIPFVSGDAIRGSDRADFEAQATRLGNLLTLDNLKLMTGVLTDRDIQLLATAGSNLLNFDQSEDSYKQEVERVIETMNRTIINNGVTPEQAVFYGIIDQGDAQTLDAIWNNL